jgi:hypothetical protein
MNDDPKFNPFRKKAEEQGIKNGWDFSGFYQRPDGYQQSTQPLARSLATIIAHTAPIIPHAPNFSAYLLRRVKEVECALYLGKQSDGSTYKTIWEISGPSVSGMYIVRERKDGSIFNQLFEGNIGNESLTLEFMHKRKDRWTHIPFP